MQPKILVADDFSPAANAALTWAGELARRLDGTIVLLHVALSTDDMARAREGLAADAKRHGLSPEIDIVAGADVGDSLLVAAETHKADMIAMGTSGRGGQAHAALGRVASHVVRYASCPVVTLGAHTVVAAIERDPTRRESGVPGGGKGRTDEVTKKGVFPYSVQSYPPDVEPELRTPASLTPNAPYEEAGRSELSDYDGQLVGGEPETQPATEPGHTARPPHR